MTKKHKCIECEYAMNWAVPSCKALGDKSEWNIRRLRRLCLETIVCGHTLKTKNADHEQYCKRFEEARYQHIDMEAQKVMWEERMGELDG